MQNLIDTIPSTVVISITIHGTIMTDMTKSHYRPSNAITFKLSETDEETTSKRKVIHITSAKCGSSSFPIDDFRVIHTFIIDELEKREGKKKQNSNVMSWIQSISKKIFNYPLLDSISQQQGNPISSSSSSSSSSDKNLSPDERDNRFFYKLSDKVKIKFKEEYNKMDDFKGYSYEEYRTWMLNENNAEIKNSNLNRYELEKKIRRSYEDYINLYNKDFYFKKNIEKSFLLEIYKNSDDIPERAMGATETERLNGNFDDFNILLLNHHKSSLFDMMIFEDNKQTSSNHHPKWVEISINKDGEKDYSVFFSNIIKFLTTHGVKNIIIFDFSCQVIEGVNAVEEKNQKLIDFASIKRQLSRKRNKRIYKVSPSSSPNKNNNIPNKNNNIPNKNNNIKGFFRFFNFANFPKKPNKTHETNETRKRQYEPSGSEESQKRLRKGGQIKRKTKKNRIII